MGNRVVFNYAAHRPLWRYFVAGSSSIVLATACLIANVVDKKSRDPLILIVIASYAVAGLVFAFLCQRNCFRGLRWIALKVAMDLVLGIVVATTTIKDTYGYRQYNPPTAEQIADVHMRAIARALAIYAGDHSGAFPNDFAKLIQENDLTADDYPHAGSAQPTEIMVYMTNARLDQNGKRKLICVDRFLESGKWYQFECFGDLTISGPTQVNPSTDAFAPNSGPTTSYH